MNTELNYSKVEDELARAKASGLDIRGIVLNPDTTLGPHMDGKMRRIEDLYPGLLIAGHPVLVSELVDIGGCWIAV